MNKNSLENELPSDAVDRMVEMHLERAAAKLDCKALADRILRDASNPKVVAATRALSDRRSWVRAAWLFATAASILIAFAIGRIDSSAYASAAKLVQTARSIHAMPLERCYVVSTKNVSPSTNTEAKRGIGGILSMSSVKIWTQGNRFWVQVDHPKRSWSWGRNAAGSVWLALGRNRGLQIEADEIGSPLDQISDWHSLELDSLLENFQTRWTLVNRETTDTSHIVTARPKRTPFHRVTGAVIEIDRESKAIRRLTINRQCLDGSELEVDFSLVETRTPVESLYGIEGHLEQPYQIFTRESFPIQRRETLKTWFGSTSEQWIRD